MNIAKSCPVDFDWIKVCLNTMNSFRPTRKRAASVSISSSPIHGNNNPGPGLSQYPNLSAGLTQNGKDWFAGKNRLVNLAGRTVRLGAAQNEHSIGSVEFKQYVEVEYSIGMQQHSITTEIVLFCEGFECAEPMKFDTGCRKC